LKKRINSGGQKEPDQIYSLVETKGVGSITRLSEIDKFVDLVLFETPEHNADRNASIPDCRRDLRVPKVEHRDALGIFEESNPRVVRHGPSNTKLPGTGGSVGRRCGFNARGGRGGRRGGRQGRVALWGVALGRVILAGKACWVWGGAGRVGLASLRTTLLLGNTVVVRKLPSQVVGRYRDSKGLGGSEGEEKDSECGQSEEVERPNGRHLFKGSSKRGRKVKSDCGLGQSEDREEGKSELRKEEE